MDITTEHELLIFIFIYFFNILKTRSVIEPKILVVHGSLVQLIVEPWSNR